MDGGLKNVTIFQNFLVGACMRAAITSLFLYENDYFYTKFCQNASLITYFQNLLLKLEAGVLIPHRKLTVKITIFFYIKIVIFVNIIIYKTTSDQNKQQIALFF